MTAYGAADVEFAHGAECEALCWERDNARSAAAHLEAEIARLRSLLACVDARPLQGLGVTGRRHADSVLAVEALEAFTRTGLVAL